MDSERRTMVLNSMTSEEINEKIFKHYNYDGLQAYSELSLLARAENARKSLRAQMPIWLGVTGISAYNCTRLSVLSASGRIGAIGGLALGAGMTIATARM